MFISILTIETIRKYNLFIPRGLSETQVTLSDGKQELKEFPTF